MLSTIDKSKAIKLFIIASATILLLNSFTRVVEMNGYTSTLVCLYLA